MSDDPQVHTPLSAEQRIDWVLEQIDKAPNVIADRLEDYQEKKHAFDLKWAKVADATEGTELAKKRAAQLACVEERKASDSAYKAYQYAKARARALEKELSGRQSVASSVKTAYNASGYRR